MLALHAVLLTTMALTMTAVTASGAEVSERAIAIGLIAATLGGLAVGYTFANTRVSDLVAHLFSFTLGVTLIAVVALLRAGDGGTGWSGRRATATELILTWTRRLVSDQPLADPQLFGLLIALTLWLVAYTSGWMLYRGGWLTTAIVVPGVVLLVNLGYGSGDQRPLAVFLIAACLLAARHHLFRREQAWARAGVGRPPHLPSRFVRAGATLALLVTVLAWTLPLTARQLVTTAAWEHLEAPWEATAMRWQAWVEDMITIGRPDPQSYSGFGDAFELGGELRLTDDPVAVLVAASDERSRTYLVGRRYNVYDGRGWSSDTESTFQADFIDGSRYSPEMSFADGLGVHLSADVLQARSSVEADIRVIRPKGDLLFTTDTFLTADRRFDVALSWRQVTDERYSMQGSSLSVVLGRLPVDLRSLGSMLYDVQFSPAIDPLTGLPVPTDARRAADILAEREELGRRFIQANWTLDPNGEIIDLVVSGQLPNYDDVEAVSTKSEIAEGSTYGVTGLTSSATPEDLRQAGSTYPTWVSERYLGLPPSITDRTRTLATRVATGQETPFDVATATEAFVRQAIRYEEKIEAPPDGWDGVDYVLFESREGYCEYYASAMAVMLRTQGIPTRVVGGYYPAPYDAAEEGYLYREKNAHLWVEVFFPGFGWIPFEPTASQDRLDYNQDDPATTATPTPQPSATPPAASPTAPPDAGASSESGPASAFFARASRHPGWWLGSFGISLGLAALFAVLIWSWRFRGLGPLSSVFARTLRLGRWVGVTTGPSTTPREYAEDLGRAAPVIRSSALLVSDLYGQEAYGGRRADPATVRRARTAWVEVRWGILRSVVRRRLRIKRGGKAIG